LHLGEAGFCNLQRIPLPILGIKQFETEDLRVRRGCECLYNLLHRGYAITGKNAVFVFLLLARRIRIIIHVEDVDMISIYESKSIKAGAPSKQMENIRKNA